MIDATALEALVGATVTDGTLEIPSGEYHTDSEIQVTVQNDTLRIVGLGHVKITSSIPEPTPPNGNNNLNPSILRIDGSSNSHLFIENINFVHEWDDDHRGYVKGLFILNTITSSLSDIRVERCSHTGIVLYHSHGGRVVNCIAKSNRYSGLELQSCSYMTVDGGLYEDNAGLTSNGVLDGYSVDVTGLNSQSIAIRGVTVKNTRHKGIDCHNCDGLVIESNFIRGYRDFGIQAVSEGGAKLVRDVVIRNNQIIDGLPNKTGRLVAVSAGNYGKNKVVTRGHFIVDGNIIENLAADKAVGIDISPAYGTTSRPIDSAIIVNNTLLASSKIAKGILMNNANDPVQNIRHAVIAQNILNLTDADVAIYVRNVDEAIVAANVISMEVADKFIAADAASRVTKANNVLVTRNGN